MRDSRLVRWTRPERAFAVIAFVFGIALILVIPPFQAADEPYHLLRAYQITEGNFVARQKDIRGYYGGLLPASLYQVWLPFSHMGFHPEVKASVPDIRSALRIPLNSSDRIFITFPNTAHYCPTCYLPQCLGIGLGRVLGLPPLVMLYLGRLGNLIVWIILGFLAIKIAPAIARPLLLLLLMPMSLWVACTLSADTSTNALAALFTALVCRLFCAEANSINRKWIAVLAAVSIPLSISKLAYVPLLALLVLIPAKNYGGSRKRIAKLAILLMVNAAASLYWISASSSADTRIAMNDRVSARSQLTFLSNYPCHLFGLFFETFRQRGWTYFQSYVGLIGWLDQYLPASVVIGYLVILIVACWTSRDDPLPSPGKTAMVVLPAVGLSFFVIAILSYLYWTPVGFSFIDGIHGRYLIPLTPAIFILLCSIAQRMPRLVNAHKHNVRLNIAAALIPLGFCIYFLTIVWNRYYG